MIYHFVPLQFTGHYNHALPFLDYIKHWFVWLAHHNGLSAGCIADTFDNTASTFEKKGVLLCGVQRGFQDV